MKYNEAVPPACRGLRALLAYLREVFFAGKRRIIEKHERAIRCRTEGFWRRHYLEYAFVFARKKETVRARDGFKMFEASFVGDDLVGVSRFDLDIRQSLRSRRPAYKSCTYVFRGAEIYSVNDNRLNLMKMGYPGHERDYELAQSLRNKARWEFMPDIEPGYRPESIRELSFKV